jgi:hypothetical protein
MTVQPVVNRCSWDDGGGGATGAAPHRRVVHRDVEDAPSPGGDQVRRSHPCHHSVRTEATPVCARQRMQRIHARPQRPLLVSEAPDGEVMVPSLASARDASGTFVPLRFDLPYRALCERSSALILPTSSGVFCDPVHPACSFRSERFWHGVWKAKIDRDLFKLRV